MDLVPSVVSDLIAGLAASGIVGGAAVLARKLGWTTARRFGMWLGWPAVAAAFFGISLGSAFLRGDWAERVLVLSAVLALTALMMLLRFGPERFHLAAPEPVQPLIRFLRTYPWRTLMVIFFLITITLLALNLASDGDGPRPERIVFVVSLDDTELLVFRGILDDLEPELGADIFLMNVDSSRYIARLDDMVVGDMKWDLIAADNNMLGLLGAKELVQELPPDALVKLYPDSLMLALRELRTFEGRFYFVPFRPNVKITYYNSDKLEEAGLEPPKNWDELLEVARDGGRVAIQGHDGPAAAVTLFEFVKAAGGEPLTLDDDGSRQAVAFLQELAQYLAPQYPITQFDTAIELLIDDQVYLVDNWTFGIQAAVVSPEKWEIKAYSGWSGPESEVHVLGGDVLAVPKGAPHADLAIRLMELLVSKEIQLAMRDKLTWMPVRIDAYAGTPDELKPYFDAVRDAFVGAKIRPTVPQWTLAEDILDRAFQELVVEGEDIARLEKYAKELADIPAEYIPYSVQDGDTLDSVAIAYQTTCEIIAKSNRTSCIASIGPGQILLVPVPTSSLIP